MNLEKVVFGFFVVLAATLNFGFFIGDIDDPNVHNPYELFAAVVVNLIATVLKFGDRTQIGAVHLATSLVADLQLIAASARVRLRGVRLVGGDDRRPGRRASSPCPAARCWPTSCRWCCSSSRRCRSTAADRRPSWATRSWRSGAHVRRRRTSGAARRASLRVAAASAAQASATIFLILRRMRAPLIVLIVIFAVSVLGLTLIPGEDAEGRPCEMGFFDAFYVMSYTATTIGFGEIPYPFTYNQRMWVTISIYLTVIGWAYAIGSLLALLQDRAFRQALALQHFTRKVARLRRAVRAGRRLRARGGAARALDRRAGPPVRRPGRSAERIDGLELDALPRRRARPGRRRPGPRPPRRRGARPPVPARRSSRSPTTTRRTSPSSWRRRCCAPTSR